MTQLKWTSDAQESWLKARITEFGDAETAYTRKTFFQQVTVDWRKEWPIPEPTASEVETAGSYDHAVGLKCEKLE